MAEVRILMVDDEPLVARLYARAISAHGWTPVIVDNAVDALDIVAMEPPALIISDMQMPGMSGLEMIAQLGYRAAKTMPVMFMSAATAAEIIDEALAVGADDFLPKGSRFDALIARLRFWLTQGVPGLPDDARAAARARLPEARYPADPLSLLDFPRVKLMERATVTLLDQLATMPADFGAAPSDRIRFLGVLSAVLALLGRSDPISYIRRGDLIVGVVDRLNLPWAGQLRRHEFPGLLHLVHDATYKHAKATLCLRP
ncbi:MAG: response regulator [Pseudomonadota bacterium]